LPELPDVEIFKNYFDQTSLNKKVTSLELVEKSILAGISEDKLKKHIEGNRFTKTFRHGKYLFARNNTGYFLVMHFGMTGRLEFNEENREPEYYKMALRFKKGSLYYISIRKLGRISFTGSMDSYIEQRKLGPDALEIGREEFLKLASKKKGMVKPVLMDQTFIAGLGNIYVDEILYNCRIQPRKKMQNMAEKDLKRIHTCMGHVLATSIKAKAEPGRMPQTWLIKKRKEGLKCPKCKGRIKKILIQGRGTYFCSGCQG